MDSFVESLPPLPDSAVMKAWDAAAIEFGLPEVMLMENAAAAIFDVLCARFGEPRGKTIWLFMGGGNNGGDAAALARRLFDAGAAPRVFCRKPVAGLHGAAQWHAELALRAGVRFEPVPVTADGACASLTALIGPRRPDLVVDGLLGTGFAGNLRKPEEDLIAALNSLAVSHGCPVLAIDIPSGLNADSGKPQPIAVRADCTVTLEAAKPGLFQPGARQFTGQVICRPIGMPARATAGLPAHLRLLDGSALCASPPVIADGYKNVYGHVFVVGGAEGYVGACNLACLAALRQGSGLVTACVPAVNMDQIRAGHPEIMVLPAGPGTGWPETLNPELTRALGSAQALVIGPGMGRSESAAAFLSALLKLANRPAAVIDADALFLLARAPALARFLKAEDVLTPHPGEAAALLGSTGADVQADRQAAIAALCALSPAAVVLKGASTLLGASSGPVLLCPYDLPLLSVGGAGDVLSGCIGSILGSRQYDSYSTLAKAAIGVISHVMAALSLVSYYPDRGILASQIADALPFARSFVKARPMPAAGLLPWPQC